MTAVGSNYQILCHFLSKTCTSGCDVRSYGRCLLYKASLPANTAAGTSYTRHKNRMRPMSKYLPNMENILNLLRLISQYSCCVNGLLILCQRSIDEMYILSVVWSLNVDEAGDRMRIGGWHHQSGGDSPGEKWHSQIDNLIVYILKVLRSISSGNPAKVSHFISPPTSFYISLQQFCGKGRTYNTSFIRKLLS